MTTNQIIKLHKVFSRLESDLPLYLVLALAESYRVTTVEITRQYEAWQIIWLTQPRFDPLANNQTNQPTKKMKAYRYEILDSLEYIVALADCLDDAIYAAHKHEAKWIYDTVKRSCVPFAKI